MSSIVYHQVCSSTYTLQADLSIDGQDILYGKIICEGTYLFPIINNSNYYLQKTKYINKISPLREIINVNVNVICYYSIFFHGV